MEITHIIVFSVVLQFVLANFNIAFHMLQINFTQPILEILSPVVPTFPMKL